MAILAPPNALPKLPISRHVLEDGARALRRASDIFDDAATIHVKSERSLERLSDAYQGGTAHLESGAEALDRLRPALERIDEPDAILAGSELLMSTAYRVDALAALTRMTALLGNNIRERGEYLRSTVLELSRDALTGARLLEKWIPTAE